MRQMIFHLVFATICFTFSLTSCAHHQKPSEATADGKASLRGDQSDKENGTGAKRRGQSKLPKVVEGSSKVPQPIAKALERLPLLSQSNGDVFGFLELKPKGEDPIAKEIVGRTGSWWERWAIIDADDFVLEVAGYSNREDLSKSTMTEVQIRRKSKTSAKNGSPQFEAIPPAWQGRLEFQVQLKTQ
jgi:hypothetical protein